MEQFFQNSTLFNEEILNALHLSIGGWFDYIMMFITDLGDELFYTIMLPILYWCWEKRAATAIGTIFLISAAVNDSAKAIFDQPRPALDKLLPEMQEVSQKAVPERWHGFPSGHTQGSVAFWGSMIWFIRKPLVYILGAFMLIMVPYSRIYLGVHFLGDVMGGYVIGILLLLILIPLLILVEKYHTSVHEFILIGLLVIIPFILYNVIPGLGLDSIMGVLSGFLIGVLISMNRITFNPRNKLLPTIIKIVIGMMGLFIIKAGLKPLLPELHISDFLRYWLVGFWSTFAAPLIFSKITLLKGETAE